MVYFGYFSFLYYSFGVEKTNTFLRSRGSLENPAYLVKIYTRFQTKTMPFGAAHTYIAYVGENPPPPTLRALDTTVMGRLFIILSTSHISVERLPSSVISSRNKACRILRAVRIHLSQIPAK